MKFTEYADLMYRANGKVSHVVPYGDPRALCGMYPGRNEGDIGPRDAWFGTGSMDEYDHAAALSLCVLCEEKL